MAKEEHDFAQMAMPVLDQTVVSAIGWIQEPAHHKSNPDLVHSLTLNAQMALLASMVSVVPTMAHSDLSAVPLPRFFGLLISASY